MRNCKISEKLASSKYSLLLVLLFFFLSVKAQDVKEQWADSVRFRIDSLLCDDMFSTSQVGVCIYNLTADTMLFAHNERQTMRPASTQKVITAIAALKYLGADYQLKTTVRYTGKIINNTLDGDLYVIGGFDPLFNSNDMLILTKEIKDMGINIIHGNIFFDKSMKDNMELGNGWCWDDDNPSLSALTINELDNFYNRFTEALEEHGLVVAASLGYSICPPEAKYLCSTYHTLAEVLPRMLKKSDNFYAESLFYNLAASSGKRWANADDAAYFISSIASQLGHDKDKFRIADGSGLSLYNYTTALLEVDFLRYAYHNPDIYAPLYLNLPIAGVDGTLKRRMKMYPKTTGNVRAKTGSVSCVSSLAGYCRAYNGHDIAFCIINQGILKSKDARTFQDKVCAILCEPSNTQLNNK